MTSEGALSSSPIIWITMEVHDGRYFNQVCFNPKKYSERKFFGQATPDITLDKREKLGIQLDSVDRILTELRYRLPKPTCLASYYAAASIISDSATGWKRMGFIPAMRRLF